MGDRAERAQEKGSPPLTEHALQPDEAADETVEVDVHVLVRIAHGDDVIELVVEVESCRGEHRRGGSSVGVSRLLSIVPASWSVCAWERKMRSAFSFLSLVGLQWPSAPLPFLLPPAPARILATLFLPHTCVIDCISHLIAVDGAGLV